MRIEYITDGNKDRVPPTVAPKGPACPPVQVFPGPVPGVVWILAPPRRLAGVVKCQERRGPWLRHGGVADQRVLRGSAQLRDGPYRLRGP
jgi:hypothetical protein